MFPDRCCSPSGAERQVFEIKAPLIARKQRSGQFVMVRLDDTGERVLLTIADANPQTGTVIIVVQAIGKTTSC